jgi:hypothetical protein
MAYIRVGQWRQRIVWLAIMDCNLKAKLPATRLFSKRCQSRHVFQTEIQISIFRSTCRARRLTMSSLAPNLSKY